ncbi:MAG: DUF4476 domain-containing protein [Myxococcota bacterium]
MLTGWLASIAWAGALRVQSPTPVTFVVDGDVVGRVATELVMNDVAAGAHAIQVKDAFGSVLASIDVAVPDGEPLWFEYSGGRLIPVEPWIDRGPTGARNPITDVQFRWVEHRVNRKRTDDKRLKRLDEVVNQYWYEMRHVDSMLMAFQSIEARVQAATMLAPRTIDPEKTRAIEDHFPPGAYRERALAAFAIYR